MYKNPEDVKGDFLLFPEYKENEDDINPSISPVMPMIDVNEDMKFYGIADFIKDFF